MTADVSAPDPRLEHFVATWNSHDLDGIVGLFTAGATIDDEFVIIDPDLPAGRRSYHGSVEIRSFAVLAVPGFHATIIESSGDAVRVSFSAEVRADGLRARGIDRIEQHDELEFEGGRVARFRIGYPHVSRERLREAASRGHLPD